MKTLQNFLLVALAAVMMSFGWLELTGLVMLGGFVPLLVLAARYDRSARSFWAMFGWTLLFIVLWYAITIWWVWYSTPAGPIAAIFFAWVYTALPFMAWFWISKRAPKALSYTVLVSVWMVGEWVYNFNQASFPWLNIGNGFAHDIWAVQWYEWTGIYGGTLWVLVTSILIYELLIVRKFAWKNAIAPALVITVPLLVSLTIYWTYKEPERKARVTIVQPNMDPWIDTPERELVDNLVSLAAEAPADARFIVMPEVAIDQLIYENNPAASTSLASLGEIAARYSPGATVVVGGVSAKLYGTTKATKTARGDASTGYYDIYNTAVAIDPCGKVDLHNKAKLVIGTEMMPDWWWVEAMQLKKIVANVGGMSGQLGYGTRRTVFINNGRPVGRPDTEPVIEPDSTATVAVSPTAAATEPVIEPVTEAAAAPATVAVSTSAPAAIAAGAGICWESVYGEYFTEFVSNGAEVVFVITNDGWWHNTPGHRQHFDFSRLRAVETRRAIARSANTGRSGFITPRGDVRQTLEWGERGTITDDVSLSREKTFYVRFGDYLCRLSLLVLGLSVLYFIAWKIRKRDHIVK